MHSLQTKSSVRNSIIGVLHLLLILALSALPLMADDDIEVQGLIQSIGPDSLVVTGITFWVDGDTEIEGPNGPISFSSLQVGMFVEVEAEQQPNGTYLATEIELDDDIEVEGPIQALSSDSVTVSGIRFLVDGNTRIRNDDDDPISFSDLNVGDYVEVNGRLQPDGSYYASRIELEDEHHNGNTIEIEGLISALGSDNLTVNHVVVFVDSTTEIRGDQGTRLTFADLRVGDRVDIRARLRADSSYLAVRIKVKNEGHEFEIDGFITDLGADSLVVGGLTFFVNSGTEVRGLHGEHLTFGDLQLNDFVQVKGTRQADSTLLATRIRLRNPHSNGEIEVKAPIDTLFNDSLVVGGILFWTDAFTEIRDDDDNLILFRDLQIGMIVEVHALLQPDSSLYATRIEVEDFFQDEVEVTGNIDSLGTDYLYVVGLRFDVDANTMVFDENNQPISFSDLLAGLRVEVRAHRQPDNSLLAERIKVKDPHHNEIELHGEIDSLGTSSVIVLGMEFLVDANTLILDQSNNPISFSDLSVGLFVEVKARIQQNGDLLATRIKVEDNPLFSQITGTVLAITGAEIIVSQPSFQLLVSTVALDEHFRPIPLSQIVVGQEVTLWADGSGGGQPAALQIKRNVPQGVTGIADGNPAALPALFELEQNYPNPFNPSTTIAMTLSSGQFHRVELYVYNVLGQRVRTLYSGLLDGGSYRFVWDGRNDQGQLVVSGVYLYQVRVDKKFAQSKQMVLLK